MDYFDWVKLYPNYVVLEKEDEFYKGTGNSAYVLNDLLDYPLSTGRYGHVVAKGNDLEEITNALTLKKISYIVVEEEKLLLKKLFEDSDYSPYSISKYIENNVGKNIEKARTKSFKKIDIKTHSFKNLEEKIKLLEGLNVYHKNESFGKGKIVKAYLSDKGEIYTDIEFEATGEKKPFMFIFCTEKGLITIDDEELLNEIKTLYKSAKR